LFLKKYNGLQPRPAPQSLPTLRSELKNNTKMSLEKKFIGLLEKRLNDYGFLKDEVVLKGTVHTIKFILNLNKINYSLLIRILPRYQEFDIYFLVEYPELSEIIQKIDDFSKYRYTFTERLSNFIAPENHDWFYNTTSTIKDKIDLQNDEDIIKLVNYIEEKYVKIVFEKIMPKINTLDKLNSLLNNYNLIYDKENNEPKMLVLSGGMIFQSVSALILNTIYNNPDREKLINMYSWLYNVLKNDENIDKIMMTKVLKYVEMNPNTV